MNPISRVDFWLDVWANPQRYIPTQEKKPAKQSPKTFQEIFLEEFQKGIDKPDGL